LPFTANFAFTDFLEIDNNSTDDDEDASDCDYVDSMLKEILVRKVYKRHHPARQKKHCKNPKTTKEEA
jgi:hypothetical protein